MGGLLALFAALSGLGDLVKEILTVLYQYGKFWVQVEQWEQAVILRLGKYHRTRGPGLRFKWPFLEKSETTNVKDDTMEIEPISITTLDGKTISIGSVIYFRVKNVQLYLTEHNDALSNMRDKSRGEMSDLIEDINWDAIRKKTTRTTLKNKLAESFKLMGVEVQEVKFTHKSQSPAFKIFTDSKSIKQTLTTYDK